MPANPPLQPKQNKQFYALDQCALFKVGSKKRLAKILGASLSDLVRLSCDEGNFEVFELPRHVCEFTGKIKRPRKVQNPVAELKSIHRRIAKLLGRIEVPNYCHGSVCGKSYRTNAVAHLSNEAVATFDLEKFFPSTTASQIFCFFSKKLHCSPDVSGLLTDLCTYHRTLATGSPVSPVLAFWANFNLFEALSKRGLELDLTLSVYVDDLTFSGEKIPQSLSTQVEGIVKAHGHNLATNKTHVYKHGEVKIVTGVAIKDGKLKVPHSRFVKARAIQLALKKATTDETREKYAAILSGVIGEAAYLDSRFKGWAEQSIRALAEIRRRRSVSSQHQFAVPQSTTEH